MSAKIEEIVQNAINKIILKCDVKPNTTSPHIATSKIAQKITLLPSTSPAKQAQPHQQDLQQTALAYIATGNAEYTRGAYQNSLKQLGHALEIYDKMKSKKYYGVLIRMADCEKKLRRYRETKKLYEEISLVYSDSF